MMHTLILPAGDRRGLAEIYDDRPDTLTHTKTRAEKLRPLGTQEPFVPELLLAAERRV
jgi:hypothetical protein